MYPVAIRSKIEETANRETKATEKTDCALQSLGCTHMP